MAFIKYAPADEIREADRVADSDNILRIHGIHGAVMRNHYELYLTLMRKRSPLTRIQREMIAVVVSVRNGCHY